MKILCYPKVTLVLFIAVFLLSLFSLDPFSARIIAELSSNKNGKLRFYWADENPSYSEADSNGIRIAEGSGFYRTTIGSLKTLKNLRFDPIDQKAEICIRRIQIKQVGFYPIIFEAKDQLARFVPIHQIDRLTINEKGMCIVSGGHDPQLYVKLEPKFSKLLFFKHFSLFIFSALLLSLFILALFQAGAFAKNKLESIFGINRSFRSQWVNLFIITFFVIGMVRIIFIITYPLNISGDGRTYFWMLSNWRSHLALSGGYPFFFGIIRFIFQGLTFSLSDPIFFEFFLLGFQHLIDFFVLILMYLALENLFGASAAAASVLLYGLNPFVIGSISTTRPEWFQSSLFLGCLILALGGYSTPHQRQKLFLYTGAALLFTLGFFTKFNLLPLCIIPFLLILLDRSTGKTKMLILTTAAFSVFCFYAVYVFAFHRPSTGTTALTHDKAWILLDKARSFSSNPDLDVENGINTKRYKLLTYFLFKHGQPELHGPSLYSHINAVSVETRKFFKEKYGYLLDADEKTLNELLQLHPNAKTFYFHQLLVAYCFGLKESDRIGVNVFFETLMAQPLNYIKNVLNGFFKGFTLVKENNFPLNGRLGWKDLGRPQAFDFKDHLVENLPFGYGLFAVGISPAIFYIKPVLWKPGINLFSVLCRIFYYWVPIEWIFALGIFLVCAKGGWRNRDWSKTRLIPVVLFILMIVFMIWSNTIYMFRPAKELILITPCLCILSGIGFVGMCKFTARFFKTRFPIS